MTNKIKFTAYPIDKMFDSKAWNEIYDKGYEDCITELQDTICGLEISHNFKCPIKKKIEELK